MEGLYAFLVVRNGKDVVGAVKVNPKDVVQEEAELDEPGYFNLVSIQNIFGGPGVIDEQELVHKKLDEEEAGYYEVAGWEAGWDGEGDKHEGHYFGVSILEVKFGWFDEGQQVALAFQEPRGQFSDGFQEKTLQNESKGERVECEQEGDDVAAHLLVPISSKVSIGVDALVNFKVMKNEIDVNSFEIEEYQEEDHEAIGVIEQAQEERGAKELLGVGFKF